MLLGENEVRQERTILTHVGDAFPGGEHGDTHYRGVARQIDVIEVRYKVPFRVQRILDGGTHHHL